MSHIEVGANRRTLQKFALELSSHCGRSEGEDIDVMMYADDNSGRGQHTIHFSNDDMEGIKDGTIYVDIE